MAYETLTRGVSTGGFKSFAKFAVGESIEGYFCGYTVNQKNADKMNLNFETESGQRIQIAPGGKLSYLQSDLQQAGRELVIGAMTKLTRNGTYAPKKGLVKESPTYEIQQDLDRIKKDIEVAVDNSSGNISTINKVEVSDSVKAQVAALRAKATATK